MITGHHLRKLSEKIRIFDILVTSQAARHLRTKHEMTKIMISGRHRGAKEGISCKTGIFRKFKICDEVVPGFKNTAASVTGLKT